jgi:hypothetical protein
MTFKVWNPNKIRKLGTGADVNDTVAYGQTMEEAWLNAIEQWAGTMPARANLPRYRSTMIGHGYRVDEV